MPKTPANKPKASTSPASRLARRIARKNGNESSIQAEYEQLDSTVIVRLIDAVVANGGTVTFGTTRDGGAYYVNYWCDGDSLKEYIRPTENPDQAFLAELEFWLDG